jgi:hypothetical protein
MARQPNHLQAGQLTLGKGAEEDSGIDSILAARIFPASALSCFAFWGEESSSPALCPALD